MSNSLKKCINGKTKFNTVFKFDSGRFLQFNLNCTSITILYSPNDRFMQLHAKKLRYENSLFFHNNELNELAF